MNAALSKTRNRWLAVLLVLGLTVALAIVATGDDTAQAVDAGDVDTVYIADGTTFADALMGATIAALNTSPMLGVAGTDGGDTIPGDTEDELDRLTNDKSDLLDTIYIFGGTSAVSADVANDLGAWANDVQRIEGDSRWGTYAAISDMLPSKVDDADRLDGRDTGEIVPRVWGETDSDEGGTSETGVTKVEINSLSIDVPSDGVLVISGTSFVRNQDSSSLVVELAPKLDGTLTEAPEWGASQVLPPSGEVDALDTLSYTTTVPVSAGTHTVTQEVGPPSEGSAADFFHNQETLTVQFYPADFSSTTSSGS